MVKVCALVDDKLICLDTFEDEEKAEEFMKNDYVLNYADEFETGEDEIVHSEEMFKVLDDDIIPFAEDLPVSFKEIAEAELPF